MSAEQEIMRYLKSIDRRLAKIEKQGSVDSEWISEKAFIERTGLDTANKRKRWRQENPELWKSEKTSTRGGVTVHFGFMYNWKEYQEKFKEAV